MVGGDFWLSYDASNINEYRIFVIPLERMLSASL